MAQGITIKVYGNVADPRGVTREEVKAVVAKALNKHLRTVDVAVIEVTLHG